MFIFPDMHEIYWRPVESKRGETISKQVGPRWSELIIIVSIMKLEV